VGPTDASTQPAERDAVTGSAAGEVGAGDIEAEDSAATPHRPVPEATPPTLRLIEQTNTARLSKAILGGSALTSWRVALQANSHLKELSKAFAAAHRLPIAPPLLADLARIGTAQVRLTSWAVEQDPGRRLLGELSGRPLGLWRDLVVGLPVRPGTGQLRVSAFAGMARLVFSGEMC
jgi:hypothetical protein